MATINHKTYNEGTETFKDFSVYDGKDTLIFKVDGADQTVFATNIIGGGSIKTSDNSALSGTAKYLSDGLGNNSVLALSTSVVGIGTASPAYKFNVVTNEISGRQNLAAIDRTAQNFVTFTNPAYTVDASMGLMLRVFPQSDARQGAGILASGGTANGTTDLDLFVSSGSASSTSYSALSIKGDSGNVGIGNSTPINQLDLNKTGAPSLFDAGFNVVQNGGTIELNYIAAGRSGGRDGAHIFKTGLTTGGTEIARFTTNGLTFNGDTLQVNALDDYEEGTFTPTFAPTSGSFASITYSTQYGKYTKIGNRVDVNIQITASAVSVGTAGGVISIQGLPFTVGAKPCPFSITIVLDWASGKFPVNGFFNDGASNCLLRYISSLNNNDAYIGGADITNTSTITLMGTYFV